MSFGAVDAGGQHAERVVLSGHAAAVPHRLRRQELEDCDQPQEGRCARRGLVDANGINPIGVGFVAGSLALSTRGVANVLPRVHLVLGSCAAYVGRCSRYCELLI